MTSILLTIIITFAALISIILMFFLYLFMIYSRVHPGRLPMTGGTAGDTYEIRTAGDIPYLLVNGLPYPTHFDESNHRRQILSGKAKMRFDPDNRGERENWHRLTAADAEWIDITLPSTYNAAAGKHTAYEGYTWFLIAFRPAFHADKDHFIRLGFQGVLLRSRVWLNGHLLGSHEGGYTPFYFDAGNHLLEEKRNILIVRSDNRSTPESLPPKIRDDHNPGWHQYGGIYRDVCIERIPRRYVFKASARTVAGKGKTSLLVDVLTHGIGKNGPYRLTCSIAGPGKKHAGRCTIHASGGDEIGAHWFEFPIKRPVFYSPANPKTYTVDITLQSQKTRQKLSFITGLRTIEVRGENILLNGEPVFLKGICKHEDDPVYGATRTKNTIRRDLTLIRKMNANYIRLAHYPHHPDELSAARDMGLLLGEEIPLYQAGIGFTAWFQEKKGLLRFPARYFGCKQVCSRRLLDNARRQLIEMIERDRNNPAVILWGVANETYTLEKHAGKAHGWLRDIARMFDNTRPVTMAELTYNIPIFDRFRSAAKHMDVISLNSYYGWYYGRTEQFREHLAAVLRQFPGKPVILSEFGADAGPGRTESDGPWKAERVDYGKTYSEEYQEQVLRTYLNIAREHSAVAGVSPWVFSDFYNTWFPHNPVPNYNLKGVVSKERRPKRAYFALQSLYRTEKKS